MTGLFLFADDEDHICAKFEENNQACDFALWYFVVSAIYMWHDKIIRT